MILTIDEFICKSSNLFKLKYKQMINVLVSLGGNDSSGMYFCKVIFKFFSVLGCLNGWPTWDRKDHVSQSRGNRMWDYFL